MFCSCTCVIRKSEFILFRHLVYKTADLVEEVIPEKPSKFEAWRGEVWSLWGEKLTIALHSSAFKASFSCLRGVSWMYACSKAINRSWSTWTGKAYRVQGVSLKWWHLGICVTNNIEYMLLRIHNAKQVTHTSAGTSAWSQFLTPQSMAGIYDIIITCGISQNRWPEET